MSLNLDPRARLLLTLGFVIAVVSTPPEGTWAFAAFAAVLAAAIGLSRVSPLWLMRRWLAALPFIGAVLVLYPFSESGGSLGVGDPGRFIASIAIKATLGTLALATLRGTTPLPQLIAALQALKAPPLLVELTALTARYLELVAAEGQRMRRAALSRGFRPRWLWQAPLIGRIIGLLFLRSHARGERVYIAMRARGYDPRVGLRLGQERRWRLRDSASLLTAALVLGGLRLGLAT